MKKGATHLEFILSFVIFVLFLVFLYGGIDPIIKTAGSKQFVLNHVKASLTENLTLSDFTTETITITVDQEETDNKGCIYLREYGNGDSELRDLLDDERELLIKDLHGNVVQYGTYSYGSVISVLMGPIEDGFDGNLKVHYATGFRGSEVEDIWEKLHLGDYRDFREKCASLNSEDYEIQANVESRTIGEENIKNICGAYNSSYNNLKDDLGVPAGSDFSLSFRDSSGGEICQNITLLQPPESLNIYVGDIPMQYVDTNATAKVGFLTITVW